MIEFIISRYGEKALSKAVSLIVKPRIEEFGELIDLSISLKEKKVKLSVLLKGEKDPMDASFILREYEVREENGKIFFVLKKISVEAREWMVAIVQRFWPGEVKFEITDNKMLLAAVKVLKNFA